MQLLQLLAVRWSCGEASRVVSEGQFDADHQTDAGNSAGGALYPGILLVVSVEGLLQVPLLQTLPHARVEELARGMPARNVPAGQVVARAGEPAAYLLVVEHGTLTATSDTAMGARVRLGTMTGPCTVDKAASLRGATHTATWTADTLCRVRPLPARLLWQLLDEEPALRQHVLRYLASEVSAQRRSRVRRAAPTPTAQVADWLAEANDAFGPLIYLAGGQQGLGDELGLSRVSVNRALAALAAAGTIRTHPRLVHVLDRAQLTSVCHDH